MAPDCKVYKAKVAGWRQVSVNTDLHNLAARLSVVDPVYMNLMCTIISSVDVS